MEKTSTSTARSAKPDWGRLPFKFLIVALVAACSFTRYGLFLEGSPAHASIVYGDLFVILAVMIVVLMNRFVEGGDFRYSKNRVFVPLAFLTAWWGISGLLFAHKVEFFLVSLLQYFLGVIIILTMPRILIRYKLVDFAMNTVLVFAIMVSIAAFIQVALDPEQIFENITATLGVNHAHLGLYMLIALSVSLYQSYWKKTKWAPLASFLIFVTILISGSRAAQTGSLAILSVYFLRRISVINLVKLIVVALLAGFVLAYIMKNREIASWEQGQVKTNAEKMDREFEVSKGVGIDKSAGRRIIMWFVSWRVITSSASRFFFGIGFTNYRWEFGHSIKLPFYTNAAHNVYLHVWTETGLLGLLLFLWCLFSLIGFSIHHRKSDPAVLLLAGLVVAMIITGFTQETLYPNEAMCNVNVFFYFVCLLFVLNARMKKEGRN